MSKQIEISVDTENNMLVVDSRGVISTALITPLSNGVLFSCTTSRKALSRSLTMLTLTLDEMRNKSKAFAAMADAIESAQNEALAAIAESEAATIH